MISNPKDPINRPTMKSTEAAALILSEGQTTDVDKANLIASGQGMDWDALARSGFAKTVGFEFSVLEDDKTSYWIVRDDETGLTVRTPMSKTATYDEDAQHIANAVIRLKGKHEKHIAKQRSQEGETA